MGPRSSVPAMQKWEYRTLLKSAVKRKNTLEDELNRMGQAGWEVCGMAGHPAGQFTLILKRPKG